MQSDTGQNYYIVSGRAVRPEAVSTRPPTLWTTKAVLVQFVDKLDWVFACGSARWGCPGCVAALGVAAGLRGAGGGGGVAAGWRPGGAGCDCAAFRAVFRRCGGRCPCCAGRRRGLVQFMDKVCLARCCARQRLWSRQCSPGCSAVAVLGPGGDMPVVATTGAFGRLLTFLLLCMSGFVVLKTVEVPQLQYLDKVGR